MSEVVGHARGAGRGVAFRRLDGKAIREPSRNRKELTALVPPWEHVPPVWELRVDEYRVFYDVDPGARLVVVRAVRRKGRSTTKEIV